PVTITSHPSSQKVTLGQTATFSVTATGLPDPKYQWRKGGSNISGATTSTYTTPATTMSDSGTSFDVVVSNTAATVISNAATVTLDSTPPEITTQPANQTVTQGDTVTFSVVATGNPAPTYQWKKNGTAISGATSASYTKVTAGADNNTTYSVVITNSFGSVSS